MKQLKPYHVKSISEFHKYRNLAKPEHPLVSVVNVEDLNYNTESVSIVLDYYSIAIKRGLSGKFKYGQQEYDFDEGVMFFISPGQVFKVEHEANSRQSGWMLLLHPDFLWNTPLAKSIKQFEYFNYSVHEALFLSEREEATIIGMMKNIEQEYRANIDKFSQDIIIAQLELLLTYADRFYHRQFITRKITNHKILSRLEEILTDYLDSDALIEKGLPTVQSIAGMLSVSPTYLSNLLKVLTGQNTQQHIHNKLIEKAKEKLSTTGLTVSEIAYELGFEHPQSFSKLFKIKTALSPLQFRQSFNQESYFH